LVVLAWFDGGLGSLERRVDPHLPLDQRGLNAPADIREGRYRRGDVLDRLRAELEAATGQSVLRAPRIHASRRAVAAVEPIRGPAVGSVVDAEFEVVAPSRAMTAAATGHSRMPSLDVLKVSLIAELSRRCNMNC
jgi:hypothetical protein